MTMGYLRGVYQTSGLLRARHLAEQAKEMHLFARLEEEVERERLQKIGSDLCCGYNRRTGHFYYVCSPRAA